MMEAEPKGQTDVNFDQLWTPLPLSYFHRQQLNYQPYLRFLSNYVLVANSKL